MVFWWENGIPCIFMSFKLLHMHNIFILSFLYLLYCAISLTYLCEWLHMLWQERIQIGKELLEAKRIEEDNERKRCVITYHLCIPI